MSNIEEDIELLKKFNPGDDYTEKIKNAIDNILAERQQDKARIKELEEALLKVKDKNATLFITCRNSILKQQKVVDKMEKLNKEIKNGDEVEAIFKIKQQQILQELLENK